MIRNRMKFTEKQVALIWQQVVGKELISTEGEPIRVIYPGRTNDDNGPDFRDAVIVNKSNLIQGDVELHVNSGDWYSHAHHCDAQYNNVILHTVMWHDCHSPTLLQNGKSVPVLCLAQALQHQAFLLPHQLPCFQMLNHTDRQTLRKLVNAAGEERFKQKAMHFQAEILCPGSIGIHKGEVGQVLFQGMMRALGYAKNTRAFEELSDRMPLIFIGSRNGLALKQALLLGTAGLLPSQRWQGIFAAEKEVQELEQLWESAGKKIKTMKERDWNFSHIYPNNSPIRRIIALSYLVERYHKETLLAGVLQLVKETPLHAGHRMLESGLTVAGNGYWREHFDFDVTSKTKIPPIKYGVLLGNSKAGEIVVNVVLPFAFAWGEITNEARFTEKAMELYRGYPRLAEHCITRHMAKQLGLEELPNFTACQQQGLIHIFRQYCREGRCSQCSLVS
jgi:hypothetical protein